MPETCGQRGAVPSEPVRVASYFAPTISTVGFDSVGFGRWMAEQAVRRAEDLPAGADLPEPTIFLIERESTACRKDG